MQRGCGMSRPDLSRARWKKSTRSGSNGDCVEVTTLSGLVAVRDSKDRQGPVLAFTGLAWEAFLDGARKGGFDR
jgi:hypothetical protein